MRPCAEGPPPCMNRRRDTEGEREADETEKKQGVWSRQRCVVGRKMRVELGTKGGVVVSGCYSETTLADGTRMRARQEGGLLQVGEEGGRRAMKEQKQTRRPGLEVLLDGIETLRGSVETVWARSRPRTCSCGLAGHPTITSTSSVPRLPMISRLQAVSGTPMIIHTTSGTNPCTFS